MPLTEKQMKIARVAEPWDRDWETRQWLVLN